MPELKNATLQEITADAQATPVGDAIPVQFNPETLKLALANRIEGGDTRAQQRRQYLGTTSTTLSFDLVFDTADEGTTADPVSVRSKTRAVEQFVLPKGEGSKKQKPPKVRFVWGDLQIDGIIDDLSIDFELFAANGMPLRAKMGVSIKEQDAKYQLGREGPGANKADTALSLGGGGAGPGSRGGGATDATRSALAGESAAGFAARVGVDPAAWRGLSAQLGSTLSLAGGVEVDFNSSLSLNAGVGVQVGVQAGAAASLEGSFGLDAAATPPIAAAVALGGAAAAGFAVAAAGGVSSAIAQVDIARTDAAAATVKRAFGEAPALGAAPPPSPAPPDQPRTPLKIAGLPSPVAQAEAKPAPPPPIVDARAVSFGFGVPLRPRVGHTAIQRADAAAAWIPLRPHQTDPVDVTQPLDPTAPPWTSLPREEGGGGRARADREQRQRRPTQPCGCGTPGQRRSDR